jgi:hypothetical protein
MCLEVCQGRGGNLLWPVEDFRTPCGGTGRPFFTFHDRGSAGDEHGT